MQELEVQYSVSRSIMRETIRALQTMGLVTTTKRIGVTIQPASRWNHFAPEVIRWKLASDDDAAAPLRCRAHVARRAVSRPMSITALQCSSWAIMARFRRRSTGSAPPAR